MDVLAAMMPDFVRQAAEALKMASPWLLIILGGLLFVFSGAMKWLVRVIGVGMILYGILMLVGSL